MAKTTKKDPKAADIGPPLPRLELSRRTTLDPQGTGLGDRLRQMRQSRKLTLEALSLVTKAVDPEQRGVTRVSLARYESGTDPGARELRLLSQALRCSLGQLIYGNEDPINRIAPTIDDAVEHAVWSILVAQKLVQDEGSDDALENRYEALLEEARKRAKE